VVVAPTVISRKDHLAKSLSFLMSAAKFAAKLRALNVPDAGRLVDEWVEVAGERILEAAKERKEHGYVRNLPAYLTAVLKNGSIPEPSKRTDQIEDLTRYNSLCEELAEYGDTRVVQAAKQLENAGKSVTAQAVRQLIPPLIEEEDIAA
jgi:hypothetical protein